LTIIIVIIVTIVVTIVVVGRAVVSSAKTRKRLGSV
jgi:hypothetical protein